MKPAGFIWTPDRTRTLRALRVLEQIGTAEARALLADLAVGHPEHPLVSAAIGSVERQ